MCGRMDLALLRANLRRVELHCCRVILLLALVLMPGISWSHVDEVAASPAKQLADLQEQEPILPDAVWLCTKEDGYRGIWYCNEKQDNDYVFKYAGGLGTYSAHHYPFAIYVPAVNKTFFCYGGAAKEKNELVHMVSYFDHRTRQVPRPTALLNKKTDDAHDNPVLAVDGQGHIWVFSSAHGRARRAYVSVSKRPYDIDDFELVEMTNFSYPQVYWLENRGLAFFHTRYLRGHRCLFFTSSEDGRSWGDLTMLAYIRQGHYQVTAVGRQKIATAFNYHPHPGGLNYRTNLYYMESEDFGRTWRSVDGRPLCLPLTEIVNDALVHDYESEGLRVYLVDMVFDREDRPIIVYILSRGWQAGPESGPRIWHSARWDGSRWVIRPAMSSDNNYDNGSLYIEEDGSWILIAPTEPGPQPFNTGGEVVMWRSTNQGVSWEKVCQLTRESVYNHGYCRRPLGVHPQFYSFWADGHGRQLSESRLYFCDRDGNVYRLPPQMEADFAAPELIHRAAPCFACGEKASSELGKLPETDRTRYGVLPLGGKPVPSHQEVREGGEFLPVLTRVDKAGEPGPLSAQSVGPEGLSVLRGGTSADDSLPVEYLAKVELVPDICQTDPLFADLPDGGRNLCGPAAFVNILLALSRNGGGQGDGSGAQEMAQARELLKLLVDRYLVMSPQGIAPLPAMEGFERFLADHGYQSRMEWRGWRRGGRFATAREIDPDWLCRSIVDRSWAIMNVGWYRVDEASKQYQRFGGHWVTLVGYRKQASEVLLFVHDPGRRSGPGKVTHQVHLRLIEDGYLAPWGGYGQQSARGIYRLEGIVLHPQAHCALLDGVIRIEIIKPGLALAVPSQSKGP
ncbi:MAG: BNR repeat-containing protein [Thermoguttaceae bacterium]|nr:BNR repeat-containing protein [Thermoguttaceae bacterium]MDW8079225.1 BNR-4 repeat-containing protein [Thermoguttaceae bacterium]